MKFIRANFILSTAPVALLLLSSSMPGVHGGDVENCCRDNGGNIRQVTYSGNQEDVCDYKGDLIEAGLFFDQHCDSKYYVYATNNCEYTVDADFTLDQKQWGYWEDDMSKGDCRYIGETDMHTVQVETKKRSDLDSKTIRKWSCSSKKQGSCKYNGMKENACVIPLCRTSGEIL